MRLSFRCVLVGVALWSFSGVALADVAGRCVHEGREADFVAGVAWQVEEEDPGDADSAWLLAFASHPVDVDALWRTPPSRRETALTFQGMDATGDVAQLQLTLLRLAAVASDDEYEARDAEDVVSGQSLWLSPGTTLSRSGSGIGEVAITGYDAKRIAGTYRYASDDGDLRCELRFDLPVLGDESSAPALPGKALPADGGEPGKAYLAVNRALHAGDLDALSELLPPERVQAMREAQGSPDFAQQMALIQALTPRDVRIVGGRVDGVRAWVDFTATEDGRPRVGTAEMELGGGRWHVLSEHTRDPD